MTETTGPDEKVINSFNANLGRVTVIFKVQALRFFQNGLSLNWTRSKSKN